MQYFRLTALALLCGACAIQTKTVNASGSSLASDHHEITSIGGNRGMLHLVWHELPGPGFGGAVLLRTVPMHGGIPGPIKTIDPLTGGNPEVAASRTHVHVVWPKPTGTSEDTFIATSHDSALTFGSPVNLSNNASQITGEVQVAAAHSFTAATPTDNVYVVWSEIVVPGPNGVQEIKLRASNDAGATFGATQTLSTGAQYDARPRIAAFDSYCYVIWAEANTLKFVASSDTGATFSAPQDLGTATQSLLPAQVQANGADVYVLWTEAAAGDDDVYFLRSSNHGGTFAAEVNVSPGGGRKARNPRMDYGAGTVHVAWSDQRINPTGDTHVFVNTIDLAANAAGAPQNLSPSLSESTQAQIDVSGSNVHVAWRGDGDIRWRLSPDAGATFGAAMAIPDDMPDPAAEDRPRIQARGKDVYIVWRLAFDIWVYSRWKPC